ncbi:tetratricopeptide repeat protein [Sulfuricurvum sp.]|uniref:tetratricopeptide repeat protein n=1 Tax=Sulfuricurvum sp. TaxID=2025608 RepID=UPI003BAF2CD9
MTIDFYNAGMNAYSTKRFEEAYEWFKKDESDPRCLFALATLYYNGQGVERSFAKSTEYYTIAAEAGILPAQVSAGFAYANAMGVPEDFDRAAYFLKMAVAQGEPAAKVTLAEIYAKGFGGGSRKEAAVLIKEVLASTGGEEAYDIYSRYELHNV